MSSLYTFKYRDGTKGREIRYRYHGKQYTHRLSKGTTAQQANIDLGTFEEALIESKRSSNPFINPLKHPKKNIISIADFKAWFLENKKTAIGRNKEIAPRTIEDYEYAFKKLFEAIGESTSISTIPNLLSPIEERLNQLDPVTSAKVVTHLRASWNFGKRRGVVSENPFYEFSITKDRKVPDRLSQNEKNAIAQKLTSPVAIVGFALLRYNGFRPCEICRNITWPDIDFDLREITIPESKRVRGRKVPILFDDLYKVLWEHRKDEGYIVPWIETSLNHAIRQAMKDAEIYKKKALYILRHSFAYSLIEAGYDISFVSHLLGHTQLSTTMIYLKLSEKELKQLHDKEKSIKI